MYNSGHHIKKNPAEGVPPLGSHKRSNSLPFRLLKSNEATKLADFPLQHTGVSVNSNLLFISTKYKPCALLGQHQMCGNIRKKEKVFRRNLTSALTVLYWGTAKSYRKRMKQSLSTCIIHRLLRDGPQACRTGPRWIFYQLHEVQL